MIALVNLAQKSTIKQFLHYNDLGIQEALFTKENLAQEQLFLPLLKAMESIFLKGEFLKEEEEEAEENYCVRCFAEAGGL